MASNQLIDNVCDNQLHISILERCYMDTKTADVHFVCDGMQIPAHKNLLSAGSPKFDAMFHGKSKSNDDHDDRYEITRYSGETFKVFLQFFYRAKVDVTVENVADLMSLGRKYKVPECMSKCENFLVNTLDEDNVCQVYHIAIRYERSSVRKFCEVLIGLKTREIFASAGFIRCNPDILKHLSNLESLSCLESELFEACARRITAYNLEATLRGLKKTSINKLFKLFRPGSMSLNELVEISDYKEISREALREMLHLVGGDDAQSVRFNRSRQKRIEIESWNEMEETICQRSIPEQSNPNSRSSIRDLEDTLFSTNHSVLLKGFRLVPIFTDSTWMGTPTNFTISELPNSNALYYGEVNMIENNSLVMLHKPLLIKCGRIYNIRLEHSQIEMCLSYTLLKPHVQVKPDLSVYFHSDPSDIVVMRGLIQELVFIKF